MTRWLVSVLLFCLSTPAFAQDAIDLHSCVLTPGGVADWPITSPLTHADFRPSSLHLDFTGKATWPDVIPPGWTGPIRYTIWFGAMVNGQCHLAASINWWNGEPEQNSGPVTTPSHYPSNLYYLDSALAQHTPSVGEQMFLMVTAGAERGLMAYQVAERTNVVTFAFPQSGGQSYDFGAVTPPVVTPPIPPVVPPVDPTPIFTQALQLLRADIASVKADVAAVNQNVTDGRIENRGFFDWVKDNWKQLLAVIGPMYVTWQTCHSTEKC